MTEKPEQEPFDELKILFQEAAGRAHQAWQLARKRSEETRQESELYRELVNYSSAAVDALTRALRYAWDTTER